MAYRLFLSLALLVLVAACGGEGGTTGADVAEDLDAESDVVAAVDLVATPDLEPPTELTGPDLVVAPDLVTDTGADTGACGPEGSPCEDGDPCTTGDLCLRGACMPGPWDACLGGTCGPSLPLACNLEARGSTAGAPAEVEQWGCAGAPALPGPERVYRFQAPYPLPSATVALVTEAEDLRLVVLRPQGEACAPGDCLSAEHLGAALDLSAGEVVYLVVDGEAAAGADYSLAVGCPLPPDEIACGDGVDNDEDGLTDCDDEDCRDDPHCDGTAGACESNYFTVCGLREIWSTGSSSARNTNENYACSDEDFSGPEYIYELRSHVAQRVRVTLGDPAPFDAVPTAQVLVLEGKCGPEACIAAGAPEVDFLMEADTNYYVVVDSTRELAGFFHISIDCAADPGAPFAAMPAATHCAPAGEPCALGEPDPGVYASYRKDHYLPHEQHPEELREPPLDGGRFHIAAIAGASGEVTAIRLDGVDVEDMLVEPLLEWYHLWPEPLVAGEPFWLAFHSRNPHWDQATSGHLLVQTAEGTVLDAEFPVQPSPAPLSFVTTSEDRETLLVHVHNDDTRAHTLTGLLVGGRDVLAADVACVPSRTVAPGESALWTIPACAAWELGAAWTVVALWEDAAPSVGVGRVLKPHFPIEMWPSSSDCPLPGLEGDNFSFFRDGGVDTFYVYWNGGGRCGYEREEMLSERLPAAGGAYLLLGDDFPWENPPAERMADTSAVLGFLTGDESDWDYYDDAGFPKAMKKARASAALWRLYPELLTYNGAMTNTHVGAFAGMADVQGIDIYNGGCAPHLFVPPTRPGLRAPYDYLRNTRNNHMPQPTWLYAQGLHGGWPFQPSPDEITSQAWSVAAAGGKGLMWFQLVRSLADENPGSWAAIQEVNRMYRGLRRFLREGDPTGMATTQAEAVVEMIRAREALVVLVLAMQADNTIVDGDCFAYSLGVGEAPYWQFSAQQADVRLTIPEDFAAAALFEVGPEGPLDFTAPVRQTGRRLTLPDIALGPGQPVRVFVLATDDAVRADVAADMQR